MALKAKAASGFSSSPRKVAPPPTKVETPPWEEIADGVDPGQLNLHTALTQLMGAVAQSAYATNEEQQQRILDIVNSARREVYNILGESE